MSIAITVVLRSSKLLHASTLFFSLFLALIGIYLGSLKIFSLLVQFVFVVFCFYAAWRSFLYGHNLTKAKWHISIDGQGHFRCQSSIFKLNASAVNFPDDVSPDGVLFNLVAGTTLWANALFLCLRNQGGETINLIIFPDALDKGEFRRLSIACKWIVAHTKSY